jgi:hypothetical protein
MLRSWQCGIMALFETFCQASRFWFSLPCFLAVLSLRRTLRLQKTNISRGDRSSELRETVQYTWSSKAEVGR